MPKGEDDEFGGATSWFLAKLVKTPAAWVGAGSGVAVGVLFAQTGPISGAIGFGTLVGLALGGLAFLVSMGISTSHRLTKENTELAIRKVEEEQETRAVSALREDGLEEQAEMLEKIRRDRDAILEYCETSNSKGAADHTLLLVSAIVEKYCIRADELCDIERRVADPLLRVPQESTAKGALIRAEMEETYRVVADARTLLRQSNFRTEASSLISPDDVPNLGLDRLVSKLEEETAISRRVESRLHSDYRSMIVMDEKSGSEDDLRESEKPET